jgi:cardiolipin synthase A/B
MTTPPPLRRTTLVPSTPTKAPPATTPTPEAAPVEPLPGEGAVDAFGGPSHLPVIAMASTSPASGVSAVAARATTASAKPFGGPDFEAGLDRQTGTRARANNRVDVLYDGVQSFAERARLIEAATASIHLQTFIFTDDATGQALADQLIAKAKAGVAVRVIIDGLGSKRSDDGFFDRMRAAGVDVRARETGLDLTELNHRWHEKHLIVDGRVAIAGGMNIADEYALGGSGRLVMGRGDTGSEPWRDVDVRIEGLAVQDAQRAFLRNWRALGGTVPSSAVASLFPAPSVGRGQSRVRVVQQHPAGDPPDDHILQLHLRAIAAATSSITIENAYFVPPPALREALVDAARRGVKVRVLTNSKESSDMGFVVDAARYFYDELLEAGVEIHEQRGGTLHSKTASFDGQYAIIGSYNLNGRSAGLDTESVVAIRDDAVARSLDERFTAGAASATRITRADVEADSFVDDVKQWMLSTLSWTI